MSPGAHPGQLAAMIGSGVFAQGALPHIAVVAAAHDRSNSANFLMRTATARSACRLNSLRLQVQRNVAQQAIVRRGRERAQ
jgi:hypothetical protein